MSGEPRVVWRRVAALVGTGYLACAIVPRLLSSVGFFLPLASFYWSLPGALLGATVYAAWTGLRGRTQGILPMVVAGMAGVLLTGVLVVRLPATIRPFAPNGAGGFSFLGASVYGMLCDLSAIVFLFALFLAAYVPAAPPGALPREGEASRSA